MSIEYRTGDALQDSGVDRLLIHICNNIGKFGAGFAKAIDDKYPIVKHKYDYWFESKRNFQLGNIQPMVINQNLRVINMVAQDGVIGKKNPQPIDYKALELCLNKVKFYNETVMPEVPFEIWMPKIGTGLAGGSWEVIEPMINNIFNSDKVVVFELEEDNVE